MTKVYISVGSNVDRERHLCAALAALRQLGETELSPVYETAAVGFDGEPFYNCVVGLDTGLPLAELAQRLRAIEADNGRVRGGARFSSRTLDLDILTYGELVGEHAGIQLPRDEIERYAFVLRPLAELAPGASVAPGMPTFSQLWREKALPDAGMRRVELRCGGVA